MKLTDAQKKEVVNKGFCKTQHTFLNSFIGILCALTIGLIVVAVACGSISWRSIETSNEATGGDWSVLGPTVAPSFLKGRTNGRD